MTCWRTHSSGESNTNFFSDRIQYKAFVFATFGSEAKSRECQGLHDHKSAKLFFQLDAYASTKRAILDRNFTPIYFLMGDEPFFIDQLSQLLIDTVLPEEQRDFNQTILYGKDTSIEEIVSVCKRFPMMADHQLVVVREAHELSRSIEKLEAYAAQPQTTTVFGDLL